MSVSRFYNVLAPWYHLIYADWAASVARQATVLNDVLHHFLGSGERFIWDAAAGIGTQAIGLAGLGHRVVASDIAEAAVRRAGAEAVRRQLHVHTIVADMQRPPVAAGSVDVVLAGDNSLPHLLSVGAIGDTLAAWCRCLRPGGIVLVTMRDYGEAPPPGTEQLHDYGVREFAGVSYALTQHWTWEAHRRYVLRLEIRAVERGTVVVAPETRYLAVTPAEVRDVAATRGFASADIVDTEFHQPVIVAQK